MSELDKKQLNDEQLEDVSGGTDTNEGAPPDDLGGDADGYIDYKLVLNNDHRIKNLRGF